MAKKYHLNIFLSKSLNNGTLILDLLIEALKGIRDRLVGYTVDYE